MPEPNPSYIRHGGAPEEVHKILDIVKRELSDAKSEREELTKEARSALATVGTLTAEGEKRALEISELQQALASKTAELQVHESRLEALDKAQPRGSKLYTSAEIPGIVAGLRMTAEQREGLHDYGKFLHDGIRLMYGRKPKFDVLTRDQNEGTDSTGGYAVPKPILDRVFTLTPQLGFVRRFGTVIPMEAETLDLMASTVFPAVAWSGESTAPSDTSVTITSPKLTAKKLISTNLMSKEIRDDASTGFLEFVATRHLQAQTKEEDRQGLVASVDPFTGVSVADSVGEQVLGTGSVSFHQIDYDELINTMDKAAEEIFLDDGNEGDNVRWASNRQILHKIRLLKDSNGNPLLAPLVAGQPSSLIGFARSTSVTMPRQTGSTASKVFLLFGDWSYLVLGDRMAVEVDFSEHVKFGEAQIMMRVMERVAIGLPVPTAFSRLKTAAS